MVFLTALAMTLGVNLSLAWVLMRLQRRRGMKASAALQLFGFLARFAVIFGAAHHLWRRGESPGLVAVFIIAAAALQTFGTIFIASKENQL